MDFLTRMLPCQVRKARRGCKSEGEAVYTSGWTLQAAALLLAGGVVVGCGGESSRTRVEPVYDTSTGRLQLLKYDANGDGSADTWSYMDGSRVTRVEIDTDYNAVIDRWEYYSADEMLEKVGSSRARDGKPDTWGFYAADGTLARLELSLKRDGRIDRIEYYDQGVVLRAEEDTDSDGRTDKWETYDGQRLASVAFDTTSKGIPDRRLVYARDGSVTVESISEPPPARP